jgi:hypothetical protein
MDGVKTERGGFEPPLSCPKLDFESSAFNRSATSPKVTSPFYRRKGGIFALMLIIEQ